MQLIDCFCHSPGRADQGVEYAGYGDSQINFNGKLLPSLGGFGKVNRLAVVLVQDEENKILAITKTSNSTGKVEAEKVKEILDNWSVTEKIIECGFDTTAANTGLYKGACTILQQLLRRQILWMACRHHILELVVRSTFKHLFGETNSPEVTLFNMMKSSWEELNLQDIVVPDIPTDYMSDKDDLLFFINNMLELKKQPRGDYKEFLELAKVILGESVERKNGYEFQIQRPGADHHARWMAKSIYIMKMTLLLHQIPLHLQKSAEDGIICRLRIPEGLVYCACHCTCSIQWSKLVPESPKVQECWQEDLNNYYSSP